MEVIKYSLLTFFISLFISCDTNHRNIKIYGTVKDSITKKPIKNAKLNFKIWVYDTKLSESKSLNQSIVTNDDGMFNLDLKKAEAFDLIISANKYLSHHESFTIENNDLEFGFELKKK